MLTELIRQGIQHIGLEGVSAGVLALLLAVALYSHKMATTGHRIVHAGSTVTHDLKVVALVLAVLLGLGVLEGVDVQRTQELVRRASEVNWIRWLERLGWWLS